MRAAGRKPYAAPSGSARIFKLWPRRRFGLSWTGPPGPAGLDAPQVAAAKKKGGAGVRHKMSAGISKGPSSGKKNRASGAAGATEWFRGRNGSEALRSKKFRLIDGPRGKSARALAQNNGRAIGRTGGSNSKPQGKIGGQRGRGFSSFSSFQENPLGSVIPRRFLGGRLHTWPGKNPALDSLSGGPVEQRLRKNRRWLGGVLELDPGMVGLFSGFVPVRHPGRGCRHRSREGGGDGLSPRGKIFTGVLISGKHFFFFFPFGEFFFSFDEAPATVWARPPRNQKVGQVGGFPRCQKRRGA